MEPRGTAARHLPPPPLAACQGRWGWRRPGPPSRHGEQRAAVLRPSCGGSHTRPLTCGPQAELHAAPLELAAALALGHNEVAAVQTGYEGGEAAVLAAATQGRRDPERPCASPGAGARRSVRRARTAQDAASLSAPNAPCTPGAARDPGCARIPAPRPRGCEGRMPPASGSTQGLQCLLGRGRGVPLGVSAT